MDNEHFSWLNVSKVDYRVIDENCKRCGGDAERICVAQTVDSETFVGMLCIKCTDEEINHVVGCEGFVQMSDRATFVNSTILDRLDKMSDDQIEEMGKLVGVEVEDFSDEDDDDGFHCMYCNEPLVDIELADKSECQTPGCGKASIKWGKMFVDEHGNVSSNRAKDEEEKDGESGD